MTHHVHFSHELRSVAWANECLTIEVSSHMADGHQPAPVLTVHGELALHDGQQTELVDALQRANEALLAARQEWAGTNR